MPVLNLATPEFFLFSTKKLSTNVRIFFIFCCKYLGGKEEKVFGAAPKLGAG